MLKYKHAPIAQRIEQARPKGEMMVQFRLGVPIPGCRSSVDRSVRDREALGSIPSTPTI
jgi:hypothetical protein